MKTYDFTCDKCTHEFDFCDGEQHHFGQSWIECPMCKEIVTEEIENEAGGYY